MGGKGSGGANGGSQYNPANVKGNGGNGQNGDYTGFAYGQNQELNQSRIQGNDAVASTKAAGVTTSQAPYEGINMPQLGTLFDPTTRPDEPVPTGIGQPLPKNIMNNTRVDENAKIAAKYLPDLAVAAKSPDAPDSFKRFVNYLIENAQGINPNG